MVASRNDLGSIIKNKAIQLGFSSCGITDASSFEEFLSNIEKRVKAFPLSKSLYEDLKKYGDPKKSAEWAKSIVVCISRYGKYRIPQRLRPYVGKHYLVDDRLSCSQDYAMQEKFETWLHGLGLKTCKNAVTARWSAVRAGIGRFGKNNFIYTKDGSWIMIRTWMVDREMDYDEPSEKVVCPENCTRCIDACPTRALTGPLMMNYGDCIPRLTYRISGLPPLDLREKMGTWLYGCDVCQDVCPLNRGSWEEKEEFPGLSEFAKTITLKNLYPMDESSFMRDVYPRLWYIEKENLWLWKSNVLRAMANSKNKDYLKPIQNAFQSSNENIREMAFWAYERLS